MTQEEKQTRNIQTDVNELDIPEFLKGKTKTIISMPEPDFKSFMRRFYMDGAKDGTVIGTARGFVLGVLITVLMYIIYATYFATHMLPMAGP